MLKRGATLASDKEALQTMKTELANYESGFAKVVGMIQSGKISTTQEANGAGKGCNPA